MIFFYVCPFCWKKNWRWIIIIDRTIEHSGVDLENFESSSYVYFMNEPTVFADK